MIRITVFRDTDGLVKGLTYSGHAGYGEEGQDIICSAVSALTLNMANSVEAFTDDPFEGHIDEEQGGFSFHFTSGISRESKLLMDSLLLGLASIQESYGNDYVYIQYKEV